MIKRENISQASAITETSLSGTNSYNVTEQPVTEVKEEYCESENEDEEKRRIPPRLMSDEMKICLCRSYLSTVKIRTQRIKPIKYPNFKLYPKSQTCMEHTP